MDGSLIRDAVFCRLLRLATIGLLAVVLFAAIASAQYCTSDECDSCDRCLSCCHELPELWFINTRHMPKCSNLDENFECLRLKRWDPKCGQFVQESLESFLATEAMKPSLFYLHGNALSHQRAVRSFWNVYHKIQCCPGPKRLVCWSWPSQRVYRGIPLRKRLRDNLRIKSVYAEYQGYYLAKLVQQMSFSQRVMIVGHSYGAIATASAAHWLGGGSLRGLTLEGGAPVLRHNLRIGMVAAAFGNDALLPGHRYSQAFVAAEKVYITRNRNDLLLQRWKRVSRSGRRALGVTGIDANQLGEYRHKLCQQTVTMNFGRAHFIRAHLRSTRFVSSLCCLAFPLESSQLSAVSDQPETLKTEDEQ